MKKAINIILFITMISIPGILLSQSITLLSEDFQNGGNLPSSWSTNALDPINWIFSTNSNRYWGGTISGLGSGDYAAVADSDLDGDTMDAFLSTPSIDCSFYTNIILSFHHYYNRSSEAGSEGMYIYIATDGNVDTGDTQIAFHQSSDLFTTCKCQVLFPI